MIKLNWKEITSQGDLFCIYRAPLSSRPPFPKHHHDFAELCWVRRGKAIHHYEGGKEALEVGDMLWVRPEHTHCIYPQGGACLLTNLAIPAKLLNHYEERYFPNSSWPWSCAHKHPMKCHLNEKNMSRAEKDLERLIESPSHFMLDLILLSLLQDVFSHPEYDKLPSGLPDWLSKACYSMFSPKHSRGGVDELVRLSGCSREHVTRIFGRYFNKTPRDWVLELRMRHATQRLLYTRDSISQIAESCGYSNSATFGRAFYRHFGQLPAKWRKTEQHTLT